MDEFLLLDIECTWH